jgi:UDP-glucose 4-epimerase
MSQLAVVIGGSGFLGSYIADELDRRGYGTRVADIEPSKHLGPSIEFAPCDILDLESVYRAVDGADVVYNFAGFAHLGESHNFPVDVMSLNVMGNLNVLEACRAIDIDRFVFASSAYAVSTKGSFYGISKFASEKIIEEYARLHGLPFTIIRYGSLYGERANKNNALYNLLKEALQTGRLTMHGTGDEVREYIHALDAAMLSVDILADRMYEGQHVILTGNESLKRRDLYRMIQEILNERPEIVQSDEDLEGHYQVTPYSFHPNAARKLMANPYIDLGQGLVNCLKQIHAEITAGETPDGDQ